MFNIKPLLRLKTQKGYKFKSKNSTLLGRCGLHLCLTAPTVSGSLCSAIIALYIFDVNYSFAGFSLIPGPIVEEMVTLFKN